MDNKDKKNGKQQNNQASDREKKVLVDRQYVETAEQMERELFADRDFEDYEPEDSEAEARSYDALISRLKKEGVYREEFADMAEFPGIEECPKTGKAVDAEEFPGIGKAVNAEDVTNIKKLQSRFSGRRHGRVQVGKVAGVALLCCACIFAASMTSEANRNYLVKSVRYLAGDDTRIIVGNDDENEDADMAEYEAVEEIEKQLGVEMPEFYYRPNGFEFVSYEIDMAVDVAKIEYQYQNNIIFLVVDRQSTNAASGIVSADEMKKTNIVNSSEGLEIEIQEIQGKQDKISTYSAQWKMNDTIYYMSGKIEEREFKKILEQMKF